MFRKHLTQFGMMVYGLSLWEHGVTCRGRMWRVIKDVYDITQSAVLLEGEISRPLNIGQVWHRVVVCHLSSFPFFINQLVDEVEKAGISTIARRIIIISFGTSPYFMVVNASFTYVYDGLLNTFNLKHLVSVSPRVVYYMYLLAAKPLKAECLQDLFVPTFSDCAQGQLR